MIDWLRGLSSRLPSLLLVVCLVTMVLGWVFLRAVEQVLIEQTGEELTILATQVAHMLDRLLFERMGDLQILQKTALEARDPVALSRSLQHVQEVYYYYAWIGVADASGGLVAATDPSLIGQQVSGTRWFEAARGRTVQVLDWDWSRPEGEPGVTFTAPLVGPDGQFRGAVASRVSLTKLDDVVAEGINPWLAQHGTSTRVEYQLLSRNGEVLLDSLYREEGRVNLKTRGVQSAWLAERGPPGFVEELHERRGVLVLTGYAQTRGFETFPSLGWTLLLRVEREEVLGPLVAQERRIGLLGGLVLVPLVGLVFFLAHRVARETERTRAECHRALVAEQALADRVRLQASLLECSREIARQLDLDRQLEAVLRAAHQLTQARYGALGVFEKPGTTFARFLTVGLDEATQAAIGSLPTGRGLLRELAHDPGVLRLKDLTQHPAFRGFPPHHPAMRSFLGVSLRARGTLYGRLYLTDKEPEFTELDEQLIQLLAAQASIAIENTLVIQDLQHTANELQQTNAALRQLSHELEEMTSIIAHDLKAPLVTIQGYAGRLNVTAGKHLDEKSRHSLEVILEVSKVMGQMVEALLEFSLLHRRPLRPQPCDLAQAVAYVWESLEESVLATGAQLSLALAPSAAYVWIDPLVLYEVLENLLGNALKFRAADRPLAIEVGSRLEAGEVLLWVKDNGRGLPAEKCEEVFQIFRKLDRETPGVGVGLAAVRRLVRLSRGRVWLESTLGQGTTVYVSLPPASAPSSGS